MNTQRCSKETRTEFFTDHVEKGPDVHEQVTKDKLTIQGRNEAASHSTRHQ
ncbi:UNVERIFIED_ORG: hypothetical protein J2X79_004514 [Arthrobacter globiformis]|nr:hypothetical protein [Arthrobacter globiformis]